MGGQSGAWTPTKRRGPIAAEFQGPGPAALVLPSLFGNANIKESSKFSSPSFTFGNRCEKKQSSCSPAPNAYDTSKMNQNGPYNPRAQSIAAKPKDIKPFSTPAPGDYEPNKADIMLDASPAYTFGLKLDIEKKFQTPAPCDYKTENADKILHTNPQYTFGYKPEEYVKCPTPAPGDYNSEQADRILNTTPSYTFGHRYEDVNKFSTPAPGDYRPEDCKDAAKAPTMHIKPKEPKTFVTPAPGMYNPESADKDVKYMAPKYSFGIKVKEEKPKQIPAPNAYSLPIPKDQPSYSLASRPKEQRQYLTPAPGTYQMSDTNQYKAKSPAYSLSNRYKIPSDNTMKPGPGTYTPEKHDHTPCHAFGIKHSPYKGQLKNDFPMTIEKTHLPSNGIKGNNKSIIEASKTTTTTTKTSLPSVSSTTVVSGLSDGGKCKITTTKSSFSKGGSSSSTTRMHSDGHRIRSETFFSTSSSNKIPSSSLTLVKA